MRMRLIILTAVMAVSLYSCSNDRDNERKAAIEKVKNSQKEGFHLRNANLEKEADEESKNKIIPPGDVKPPKGKR